MDNQAKVADKPQAITLENVSITNDGAPRERLVVTMVCFSAFISISAAISNFDQLYGGTVLLMVPFNDAFGDCQQVPGPAGGTVEICQLSALQQSLVAVTSLFVSLGSALSIITGTYVGRRGTIQFGAVVVLIGAAGMLGTNSNYLNYMVCKCIGGVGLGFLYAGTVSYGVECMPPSRRGMLLSLFNVGLGAGSALAAGVCAGTAHLSSNWSWKTPIACQIPLSIALAVGVLLFPESPRWLLLNNREEKARRALGRFMHLDPQSETVTTQIRETQTYLDFEKAASSASAWTEMFENHNLRRTLISMFVLIIPALSGTFFIIPYTAIFLGGLGIANPFLITAVVNLCLFAGSWISGVSVEFLGRRLSLIVGMSILATCMLIFSAVSSGLGTAAKTTQGVLIAFLCLWCFMFSGFVACAVWVSSAEMHSMRFRTYGQGIAVFVNNAFAFAAQFWTPYMINAGYGNMGTNVGYFYFGLLCVLIVVTIFFVPETACLKLEQIDDYFVSGVPAWKTSMRRNKEIAVRNVLKAKDDPTSRNNNYEL